MTAGPPGTATLQVVVVGDVMIDVLAAMSGPLARGSDTPSRVRTRIGGSAANVAAWLAVQGVPTTYVGRVGEDPFGTKAVATLVESGVDVRIGVEPDAPTGTCVVLVDPDGERSMLPDAGANATLTADDLPAAAFHPDAHLHLSGYTLLNDGSRDAGLAALALARDRGMTTSVDASSTRLLHQVGTGRFLDWTRGAGLLLANRDEARALTGRDDVREAAAALSSTCGEVVVKHGFRGALWHGGFISASAPAETGLDVVDTTGAGDAFAAGFLASWLLHPEPESALAAGNRLAASVIGRIGARP
ncbi:MAG: carbohydrate kinase family protein [Actinomycetes bacterium]